MSKAAIRETIQTVLDLYNDNYLLINTDIATIESLKQNYSAAKNGHASWDLVFSILAQIYHENKGAVDKDTCSKCEMISDLKKRLVETKKHVKTLTRAQDIKSEYSEFLDEENLPEAFRRWSEITVLPDRPEFNYWYHSRLLLAKFDPVLRSGIVWDDRSGVFVKVNEAYNQSKLRNSDKYFQYNPSQAGFILNRVTQYLNDYDVASNEEGKVHAVDKMFIMLFSYFDLMGTAVALQDLISSNDAQILNLYCALLRSEDVQAIAVEDGTTIAKFMEMSWLEKWYTLGVIFTRSLYDPAMLKDILLAIGTWKNDPTLSLCAKAMSGGMVTSSFPSSSFATSLAKLLGF